MRRRRPTPSPGELAYKTGTSYGFRDAWAVGYDGRHTIAVWVGRPDGASTPGLAGRTAAAPLLFDAFARLAQRRAPLPAAPAGTLNVAATDLPPPLKRFREARDEHPPAPISSPPYRSPSRPTGPSSTWRTATAPASSSRPRAAPCRSPGSSTACRSHPTRQARGRAAGGEPRLPQALRDRRQGPRRRRDDPAEVATAPCADPGLH